MATHGIATGRIAGLPVRIKPGAVVLFGLIVLLLAVSVLPGLAPGLPVGDYWGAGLAGAVLFDIGVLAHELAHAILARRAGMRVEVVGLELFGGGTELRGRPHSPWVEARIALAGPAASLAFAGVLALVSVLLAVFSGPVLAVLVGGYVAAASLVVALVNLLPGAPLDGGRVLHAWLWHGHGDRRRADIATLRAGLVIGAVLLGIGIMGGLLAGPGGWWLAAGGLAMLIAARGESRRVNAPPQPTTDPRTPEPTGTPR